MAEEAAGDRSADGDFLGAGVGFAVGNDGILHFASGVDVAHAHAAQKLNLVGGEFAFVDNACIGHELFELGYFHFKKALSFFCRVILGILAEVTFVAGLGDSAADFGALDSFKVVELFHLAVVALFGHISYCHSFLLFIH